MTSVSIILIAQLAVKILGMFYRLVITNIEGFGDSGNGFYQTGFQVYTLLLAISSVGIPNAVSKMVSEKTALGDYKGAHRIFKTALLLFAGVGLACSALLYFGADFIANEIIGMGAGVSYTMRALAPSTFFVCVSSVISGYFLGNRDMRATSSSQVLEQFFKCTLTITIVFMLAGQAPEIMSAGANLATTIATMLSFAYLWIFYSTQRKGIMQRVNEAPQMGEKKPIGKVMASIIMIAFPIALSAIITSITRIIDTATIARGIKTAFEAGIPGQAGVPTMEALEKEAVRLAGQLSKSDTLTNLPLALNIAFSTALVPTVSSAMALGKREEASGKILYSMLISILLVLPCAIGYIALAKPIYSMLYPNASLGFDLLMISSVALVFMALNQTISGALQGLGKIYVPAVGLLIGGAVKVILNVILIRQPSINIYGAAISTVVCHFIAFGISFYVIVRELKLKVDLKKYLVKPLISAVTMGAAAVLTHRLVLMVCHKNMLAVLCAIAVGVIVYAVMLLFVRVLGREEIEQLPMGKKLTSIPFIDKRL
ncbi:MAG: polysaccharide biosynthesis protein [Clostridia bacterium]|nr:polysaccharide biosynthesis protein [Clostridia bacterium]